MKKIISIIISVVLGLNVLSFNVFANEVEPAALVCPIIEGYAVKSKTVSYEIEHTAVLINDLSYAVPGYAEFSRTKETIVSGTLSLNLIEDLLDIEAEMSAGQSSTMLLSASPTIPAFSTVYVDFGYRYVTAQIQWQTQNLNCSTTWSGEITTVRYTTESYLRIR